LGEFKGYKENENKTAISLGDARISDICDINDVSDICDISDISDICYFVFMQNSFHVIR